jgi:hypothetical protein
MKTNTLFLLSALIAGLALIPVAEGSAQIFTTLVVRYQFAGDRQRATQSDEAHARPTMVLSVSTVIKNINR